MIGFRVDRARNSSAGLLQLSAVAADLPLMTTDGKRQERRIRSRGEVSLLAKGLGPVPCIVYDISVSGLGLELEAHDGIVLSPGMAVEIHGGGLAGEGVVRYCEQRGAVLRIGVQLLEST